MKVKEVMTAGPKACMPETSLAEAAALMWENDCGVLPVVNVDDRVVGVITDRDICFGAMTKNRPPAEVSVCEVTTGKLFACAPEDDIREALQTMRHERVRRLPVVGDGGRLEGILSLNDVVLRAEAKKRNGKTHTLTYADVVETYKAVCAHPLQASPQRRQAAAV